MNYVNLIILYYCLKSCATLTYTKTISKKYIQYIRIFNIAWYRRRLSSRWCVLHIDSVEKDLSLETRIVGVGNGKSTSKRSRGGNEKSLAPSSQK